MKSFGISMLYFKYGNRYKMSKLTGYDWLKLFLHLVAVALTIYGCIFSRGHMFIGFAWMACAFVILDKHDEEEDVL